jgi:probable HAF family extracellular repeat protein
VSSVISKSLLVTALIATATTPAQLAARDRSERTAEPVQYSVIALGTLGGSASFALAVNREGSIAGDAFLPGDGNEHAVLWRRHQMKDLGTLGGPNSTALALNDADVAAGVAESSTPDPFGEDFCHFGTHLSCFPVVWSDGRTIVLPTLGGNNGTVQFGLTERGVAVGYAETATHDPTCAAPQALQAEAVVWETSTRRKHVLPTFPGDPDGEALAINERGDVVGATGTCVQVVAFGLANHAVLWRNDHVTNLGSLGGSVQVALAINNRDQVAGVSNLPGDATYHAFIWRKGMMTDLGTLPGDSFSWAWGINDQGQVVGYSSDANGNSRAFLWQDGVMTDLNSLIPPTSSLYLTLAWSINSRGEIVGFAYDQSTGSSPAFLALPSGRAHGVTHPNRRVFLPESVRHQPQLRGSLGRFGAMSLRQH